VAFAPLSQNDMIDTTSVASQMMRRAQADRGHICSSRSTWIMCKRRRHDKFIAGAEQTALTYVDACIC